MQRSVVRAHPALLERVTRSENRNGNRSQSRNHARLYRVQAPELPDAEVEAKLARPRRVPQVLPLVRQPHAAPGDALGGAFDPAAAETAPRPGGGHSAVAPRLAAAPDHGGGAAEAAGRVAPRAPRRGPSRRTRDPLRPGIDSRAEEGRVAVAAAGD